MERDKKRPREKTTILLVEDEQVVLNATSEVLSYLGYRVLTAENGIEALQAYKHQHNNIDLVLLDLQMPFMDGTETYRHLKALNPNAKIIVSTAKLGDANLLDQLARKKCGYLRKPYMPRELEAEINRILHC